ncbi:MAG TPA: hypothetical protein VFQ67_13650 [Allosphingosinicella sp.]|jgi:L-ascorbate metabolism protein UlaG (beta-lactamase superfamily)|nr:hypothetical protein [Allosphingosinicella sp.]
MRFFRSLALAAATAALAGCMAPPARRPPVTRYPLLEEEPSPPRPPRLTARFLGTSTLVLSDGRTTIMTDGFFSRPSVGRLILHPVAPRERRIRAALDAAHVTRAAAIFVAHSHHDHAMDAPYVAHLTGATIVGSPSTANIALGVGFPDGRIERMADGSVCRFGAFVVTIFKTPHSSPMPFPGEIRRKLRRSAWVEEYKEGGNFTFHVAHPWGSVLIVPSRGARADWRLPLKAETVFLGVGGIVPSARSLGPVWDQYVAGSEATRVFPIHWDNFFKELDLDPPAAAPKRLRRKLGYLQEIARLHERTGGKRVTVDYLRFGAEEPLGSGTSELREEAAARGCAPDLRTPRG